jgi:hypothetical protein
MNCKQARALAIEQVRAGSTCLNPHVESCPECAQFLETQRELDSLFAAVSRDVPEPPHLEARLAAEFEAAPRASTRWWIPVTEATAASLTILALATLHPIPPPHPVARPFVEIPYTAPLAPYERSEIVRMDLPVSALIAAGFEVDSPDTGAILRADVLFGQDGRAHAIRLLSNSPRNSN